jgi:nitrite reductase (NADH) small subunit
MTLLEEATTAPAPTVPIGADGAAGSAIEWVDICAVDDLDVDRGVGALVAGQPVALFRCSPWDELFAVSNIDPYSSASVLSRGIVGSIGHRHIVVSPVFKNRFDLHTGSSVDDPTVTIATYPIRAMRGRVQVATRAT